MIGHIQDTCCLSILKAIKRSTAFGNVSHSSPVAPLAVYMDGHHVVVFWKEEVQTA